MSMKKYNIKTTDVELLKKWYYLMTLGRALDEKAPAYLLQSLGWSFHAPYAGHDGIQSVSYTHLDVYKRQILLQKHTIL